MDMRRQPPSLRSMWKALTFAEAQIEMGRRDQQIGRRESAIRRAFLVLLLGRRTKKGSIQFIAEPDGRAAPRRADRFQMVPIQLTSRSSRRVRACRPRRKGLRRSEPALSCWPRGP